MPPPPHWFWQERETFSVMSFFYNPMFLMMGVSVLLMVVMPKMLPEVRALCGGLGGRACPSTDAPAAQALAASRGSFECVRSPCAGVCSCAYAAWQDVLKEMETQQAQMGSGNPMDMLKKALAGDNGDGEAESDEREPPSSAARRKKKN